MSARHVSLLGFLAVASIAAAVLFTPLFGHRDVPPHTSAPHATHGADDAPQEVSTARPPEQPDRKHVTSRPSKSRLAELQSKSVGQLTSIERDRVRTDLLNALLATRKQLQEFSSIMDVTLPQSLVDESLLELNIAIKQAALSVLNSKTELNLPIGTPVPFLPDVRFLETMNQVVVNGVKATTVMPVALDDHPYVRDILEYHIAMRRLASETAAADFNSLDLIARQLRFDEHDKAMERLAELESQLNSTQVDSRSLWSEKHRLRQRLLPPGKYDREARLIVR